MTDPLALVDADRLRQIVVALVGVPSPTGDERPLAEYLAGRLRAAGADGRVQPLDDRQANAYGRLPGDGTGADLLLYAPIDTMVTDTPELGADAPAHMRPEPVVDGDVVVGLGAGNPKGHAACVLHAVEVVAAAGVPLRGDLLAGFGAGGMPTNTLAGPREHTGHGVGAGFLLERGVFPDRAVIAKPGTGVTHEEVGLAWFEVTVPGTHTYVGSRHLLPYRNPVVAAGAVAARIERWCEGWAQRHTDGQVAPQGLVAAVAGGWWRSPAFSPAGVRLRVDLRLSPRTTPAAARREFTAAVAAIGAELGLDLRVEMLLAIPGAGTGKDDPVVAATVGAWSAEHGRAHEWPTRLSGGTDANILRGRGVPTARVGMPKVTGITDFALGMNSVSIEAMARLTRVLVRVAVDLCTRDERR